MGQDTIASHLDASKNTVSAPDARGREIVMRKPTCLQKFELAKILGHDALNTAWYMQCMMLLHISSIDGDPAFFGKESELKALVQTLDDDGIETATKLYMDNFSPKPFEEVKGEIKKSPPTQS